MVKCVAQINHQSKGELAEEWQILRNMVRKHGLMGDFGPARGLNLTILRETPSFGLYFLVYEGLSPSLGTFHAGGFAGVAAWSSIYPIDVVKTRWQTAPPGKYKSLMHCLRSGLEAEGASFLLRGYGATMMKAWPQNAVIFSVYELVRGWIEGKKPSLGE